MFPNSGTGRIGKYLVDYELNLLMSMRAAKPEQQTTPSLDTDLSTLLRKPPTHTLHIVNGHDFRRLATPTIEDEVLKLGNSLPPGANLLPNGVMFIIHTSPAIKKIEVCLFDGPDDVIHTSSHPLRRIPEGNRWSLFVPELKAGQRYAYKVTQHECPTEKVWPSDIPGGYVLDPYSPIDRSLKAYPVGKPFALSVVVDHSRFDWQGVKPVRHPPQQRIIYEAQLVALNKLHPAVMRDGKGGTYSGMANEQMIAHLKDLGVTAIEILPISSCITEPSLLKRSQTNLWGYQPISQSPEPAYSTHERDPQQVVDEAKEMIRAIARENFEVLLDIVLPHTGEGLPRNEGYPEESVGPTISFRALCPKIYLMSPEGRFVDYTGCGNTQNIWNPDARRFVIQSLVNWAENFKVSGFRFDQGGILFIGVGNDESLDARIAITKILSSHPELKDCIKIVEPWDCRPGEAGFHLGNFPIGWSEWNSIFRDSVRLFWKGQESISNFARAFYGTSDRFGGRSPADSINNITTHDGFTLWDLYSYGSKHNEANGENNRDGPNDNHSWNCGHEGMTGDAAINELRIKMCRNAMATLLLSRGVPMIRAGDEILQTQKGNNNPYCQDNEVTWINWDLAGYQKDFLEFTKGLIALRKSEPAFTRMEFLGTGANGEPHDIVWFRSDGSRMQGAEDWNSGRQSLGILLLGEGSDGRDAKNQELSGNNMFILVNQAEHGTEFVLPQLTDQSGVKGTWELVFDTALSAPFVDAVGKTFKVGEKYKLEGRSFATFRFIQLHPRKSI